MGRIARIVSWPLRRFFDPRFDRLRRDLFEHLADLRSEALELNHEAVVARGDIAATVHRIEELLESDTTASSETAALVGRSLADLLEYAEALQREVAAIRSAVGAASADGERRRLETAYAMRALGGAPRAASILLLGGPNDSLQQTLSSLGYRVETAAPDDGESAQAASADVLLLLGEEAGTLERTRRLLEAVAPDGLVVLSTSRSVDTSELLPGLALDDVTTLQARGGRWTVADEVAAADDRLLLVTARRPS